MGITTPSLRSSIDYMDTMGKKKIFIYYFYELLKQKSSGSCEDSFFNFK